MTATGRPNPAPVSAPLAGEVTRDESGAADLIETLVNGVRGYRTAADAVENAALATKLRELGERRRSVTEDVIRTATDAGLAIDVDIDGTAPGGLHRAWIQVEGAVAGDGAVVKSAINGEEHALEECEEALGAGMAEPVAAAVRAAAEDIRTALETLRAHTS